MAESDIQIGALCAREWDGKCSPSFSFCGGWGMEVSSVFPKPKERKFSEIGSRLRCWVAEKDESTMLLFLIT